MLAQAAIKIKAFNTLLTKPFSPGAGKNGYPGAGARATSESRFQGGFARSRKEVLEAQRLRFRVFSEAYGASFTGPLGLDRDRFDKHCLHLVVRDTTTGELVGYTRILTGDERGRCGGFYSEQEFHMGMVNSLDGQVAEIGRTCIHPDYRGGAVIAVLWSLLADFMLSRDIRYLIGCASVSLGAGYDVRAIMQRINEQHLTPLSHRVAPRLPFPAGPVMETQTGIRMPPLLKAYLRMGAQVCGEPCWDPDFNCLDFFVLLARENLPSRYVQHFLQPLGVTRAVS